MIIFFKKITRPNSHDEDLARKEYILNAILVGLAIVLTVLMIFLFIRYFCLVLEDAPISFVSSPFLMMGVAAFFWILLLFSKLGFHRIVAYIFVSALYAFSLYLVLLWSVDFPPGLLFFVLVIITSGILVGARFGLMMTAVVISTILLVGFLQINNAFIPNLEWRGEMFELYNIILYAVIMAVIAAVCWLSNCLIVRLLEQARQSKIELTEERNLLEAKVEDRTMRLKQVQMEKISHIYRLAEFGKLASGLFHDLMNPLTAASLNMEKIKCTDAKGSVTETKKHLSEAIAATKHMEGFINAIRKHISQKSSEQAFSVPEEIDQVIQIIAYKANKEKVEIRFAPAEDIFVINGDIVRFNQAIINLLTNAVDSYCDIDKRRENRVVEIGIKKEKKHICISIKDWGCGIEKENLKKIFQPFFTTKGFKKGVGIGLSLTKKIIQDEFNGEIEVVSNRGLGSTFTIRIPEKK